MKKSGILNPQLSFILASMGHSDRLVICDSGLPIPRGARVVDLALVRNIPRFVDAVRAVLQELVVESAVIAREMEGANPKAFRDLMAMLGKVPVRKVPHEKFKGMTNSGGNVTFLRTGEATPFANVLLVSGVDFN